MKDHCVNLGVIDGFSFFNRDLTLVEEVFERKNEESYSERIEYVACTKN